MGLVSRFASETGFNTLARSTRNVKLMCLQRFVRLFAYGSCFIILVQFFSSLGVSDDQIGLFMTFTLLGDAVISLVLTLITDQVGRRSILILGSASMIFSGFFFVVSSNYWILLIASVFGVISPSGAEIGPFRAVEESILAQLTDKQHRSDIYTWYTLFGHAGTAVGTLTCGWTVQILSVNLKWDLLSAYRIVFAAYALAGGLKLIITLMLSSEIEVEQNRAHYDVLPLQEEGPRQNGQSQGQGSSVVFAVGDDDDEDDNTTPPTTSSDKHRQPALHLFPIALPDQPPSLSARIRSLMPSISSASYSILYRLLVLLSVDAFASGLASASWMTYFFTTVHKLQPSSLGTLFLVTGLLSTLSNFAALPLTRRIGPLLTMSACHFPSTIFLGLIPFFSTSPSGTWWAMAFLAFRACTQSMDVAPRQAFLSAAVLPAERTAVLGIVNVAKTLANAGGIGLSGVLAEARNWKLMFASAGLLKAGYDLLMLAMFYGIKDREDQQAPP